MMRAVLEKCLLAHAVNGVYRWRDGWARRVLDGGVAEAGKRRASTRPDIGSMSTFYSRPSQRIFATFRLAVARCRRASAIAIIS
jgi:hypothetical protein